jgi:hypothetical protein
MMKKLGSLFLWLALAQTGRAVSVLPFTESFEASSSGWVYGTSSAPTWSATGGVGNSGFISAPATVSGSGFGAIVFRGNDANNASGDAFVGNWLSDTMRMWPLTFMLGSMPAPAGRGVV